jgi:IS5 family transposase
VRQKINPQRSLFDLFHTSAIAKELRALSEILDTVPQILDEVHQDLLQGRRSDTGRRGLSAEQVLRCAVLKQYREFTYEELAFYLEDSSSIRAFARLGVNDSPHKSALQESIKRISEDTWESLHHLLLEYASDNKIDKGTTVRIDSTAVETDIHAPTDSSLLADGIRIMTRWMAEGHKLSPKPDYRFSDHRRVAKKRALKILNTRKQEIRVSAYRDLVDVAQKVCSYAREAIPVLGTYQGSSNADSCSAHLLAQKLERAVRILEKIIDQTKRRVFKGEKVPASEKVLSLFETHSDLIVKSRRGEVYGHKVFFTGGVSNLILDCMITRGNPADSDIYIPMLQRHKQHYDAMPRKVSADGGFASKDNLAYAREQQVKDAVFSKRRGLGILDMAKSNWVYKKLRNFRAGIEANISALKRRFGLSRCPWSGWRGFRLYVWSNVVSYNLLVLARISLAKA